MDLWRCLQFLDGRRAGDQQLQNQVTFEVSRHEHTARATFDVCFSHFDCSSVFKHFSHFVTACIQQIAIFCTGYTPLPTGQARRDALHSTPERINGPRVNSD